MNQSQMLFRRAAEGLKKVKGNVRKLYTNSIYPYPYKYYNEIAHPGRHAYRETFIMPEWLVKHNQSYKWLFRIFWTHWWYRAFSHPEAFTGHFHPPDPNKWTDAELGIPPLEDGSHEAWLENKLAQATE